MGQEITVIAQMMIRKATFSDRNEIREVYMEAFSDGEAEIVADLSVGLLSENLTPDTYSMVAIEQDLVVGHIAFSPVFAEANKDFNGYILAPLAVKPGFQKSGLGSKLINNGIKLLSEIGVEILFVYGDPDYYGRFGFSVDSANGYNPPYDLQYPLGWQALVLEGKDSQQLPLNLSCVSSLCDPQLW